MAGLRVRGPHLTLTGRKLMLVILNIGLFCTHRTSGNDIFVGCHNSGRGEGVRLVASSG